MATNQLNEEIQKTQEVLSFVRRPPLSVKLLSRPPFKFIHDLVTEIMKMLEDIPERLFYSRELDKNSFETKEQKTQYLEKLVSWASYLVGHRVDVAVRNILAGKEPEKTNRFLQALAEATKIAEGEPQKGFEAADHANGKPTPLATPSSAGGALPREKSKERNVPKGRRPRSSKDGFEEEEEGFEPRIIKDNGGVVSEEEDFQVVSVADGKIKTRQLNQRERLKDAKNVDEFEEHGILVRKILEMKRGIEEMERHGQEDDAEAPVGAADSVDRQQKDREQIRFRREVAEMRRKIQTLAGCVTPMGRQMDEVQIAVDVMVQEYAQWRDENAFLRERLIQERTASTASLAPLQTKLRIIQADIADKVEHIRSQKRSIKLNDERMRRILNKGIQMGKESN